MTRQAFSALRRCALRQGLLRVRVTAYAPVMVVAYGLVCGYLISTVLFFLRLGNGQLVNLAACLLYASTRPSSFYLLYGPLAIFIFSRSIHLGEAEPLIRARCPGEWAYREGTILSTLLLSCLAVAASMATAAVVYAVSLRPQGGFYPYWEYLRQQGVVLVPQWMAGASSGGLVAVQGLLLVLGLFSLGLFLCGLRLVLRKPAHVVLVALTVDFLLLLACREEIPQGPAVVLPFTWLFLPGMGTPGHLAGAFAYWGCVLLAQCAVIALAAGRVDWIDVDGEK